MYLFLASCCWFFGLISLTINLFFFLSECLQYSDCPNGGQNYECVDELCTCAPGHALDGDACVGMLSNIHLLLHDFKGYIFTSF